MKKGLAGFVAAVILLFAPSILGADRKPIVAVFDIEAKRIKLSGELLDELCDHLATRLTETGKYQVVPRSELKKRLLQQAQEVFGKGKEADDNSSIKELHAKIGQLSMENDFLAVALGRMDGLSARK